MPSGVFPRTSASSWDLLVIVHILNIQSRKAYLGYSFLRACHIGCVWWCLLGGGKGRNWCFCRYLCSQTGTAVDRERRKISLCGVYAGTDFPKYPDIKFAL
jgi:hypothetical protein